VPRAAASEVQQIVLIFGVCESAQSRFHLIGYPVRMIRVGHTWAKCDGEMSRVILILRDKGVSQAI